MRAQQLAQLFKHLCSGRTDASEYLVGAQGLRLVCWDILMKQRRHATMITQKELS
jgi:hypothetical protein